MDKLYEELDDAKAEIEKLRAEYKVKADLCENLKRSHREQLRKLQEVNLKVEKQAQELNANANEIYAAKHSLDDLKRNLREREGIIKGLTASYDKLRVDSNEKLQRCGEEKGEVVLSLEEANMKNLDLEQKIRALGEEIEILKDGLLSVSHKKSSATSRMAKVSKDMRERDDTLIKVEEENRKLEEELKWKKEQFKHLEEAHLKLRDNLLMKEKEWDMEKSTLFDEISTLQIKLDSLTRLSDSLQRRLENCNQALAHEESRRKCLEVQLSESKSCFDEIFSECEEAKSKLQGLTSEMDKDVAYLRNLLGEKESFCKEMEYHIGKLEEENHELKFSLKELRELQIQEAGTSSSISKLRNKLKSLENIHRDCLEKTKVKEAEWSSRFEKVIDDMNSCKSELESKESLIKELRMELEDCNSLILQLTLQKEESMIMVLVMQSGVLEAQLKIDDEKIEKGLKSMGKREEIVLLLINELETKNMALVKAQENVEQHEKVTSISRKVESLKLVEEEVDRQKEQLLQMKSDLRKVCDLFDKANEELAQKICEGNEVEFELQIWKSVAERLKANLEQSYQMRREVEASLLAQVAIEVNLRQERDDLFHALEERERRIRELQQKLVSADEELKIIREAETCTSVRKKSERENSLLRFAKENINDLEKELEQEWVRKELEGAILAKIEAEGIHEHENKSLNEHENKSLNELVEEKDQRINNLQKIVRSLEEEFDHSTASFSSELVKMQSEVDLLHEAWEKITTAQFLKEIEIQEKNLMIVDLEDDLSSLGKKLSSERETLLGIIGEISERISKLSSEDVQLMVNLRRIVKSFNESGNFEFFDLTKENRIVYPSPTRKTVEATLDERSPLRALNN